LAASIISGYISLCRRVSSVPIEKSQYGLPLGGHPQAYLFEKLSGLVFHIKNQYKMGIIIVKAKDLWMVLEAIGLAPIAERSVAA
jgi:hypothetical protein